MIGMEDGAQRGALMESEIREQPGLLRAKAEPYLESLRASLSGRSFDQVLLIARGSSDNAALYARYLIEICLGVPVSLAAPSVLTRYGVKVRYQNCLAIGISQSGAAPDVAEMLAMLRESGHHTLAITNTAGSRVEKAAESAVYLGCGPERSVAATKTFSASLLALYQTVRALRGDLPDPVASLPTDQDLEAARTAAAPWVPMAVRSNPVFSLARGYRYSIAMETALKLMECALIPCKSFSSADFQHGPRALAREESCAVVYGEAIPGLEEQGCVVIPAPRVAASEVLAPFHDVLFGQWLALLCARARGLDPDRPEHIQKVTQTL